MVAFLCPDGLAAIPRRSGPSPAVEFRDLLARSAAMLLHCYGVRTSEGEMAYLANTSLFGTDARSIRPALNAKLARHGPPSVCGTPTMRPAYSRVIHSLPKFTMDLKVTPFWRSV